VAGSNPGYVWRDIRRLESSAGVAGPSGSKNRSEKPDVHRVSPRDYLMKSENLRERTARSPALRVDVNRRNHGAFDSTAQPTKFPGRLLPHRLRLVRPPGLARQGQGGLHEQGGRGGPWRIAASFRITGGGSTSSSAWSRRLALEMKVDPIDLRMAELSSSPSSFPVRDERPAGT